MLLPIVPFVAPSVGAGTLVYLRVVDHALVFRRQPLDVELDLDAEATDLLEYRGATCASVAYGLELNTGNCLPNSNPAVGGGVAVGRG